MAYSREQKLVDLCFEMVLLVTSDVCIDHFRQMTAVEKAKWVSDTLKECGFSTKAIGSSWGVLEEVS